MSSRSIHGFAAIAMLAVAGCTTQPTLPPAPSDLVAAVNAKGANECNGEVARVLAHHGVTAAMFNSVRYIPIFEAHGRRFGGDSIIGQTAWVYLNNSPGVALIQMGNQCGLQSVGFDGAFKFPG